MRTQKKRKLLCFAGLALLLLAVAMLAEQLSPYDPNQQNY